MSVREIILQDVIARKKNVESPLQKNIQIAKADAFLTRYATLLTYFALPVSAYFYLKKRHTGRTVYRNALIITGLATFGLNLIRCDFRRLYTVDLEKMPNKRIYRYAILDKL